MQTHVIAAVCRRQLASYFASPAGYVFITIFVFLSSLAAFWTPAFFDRNLANLDQLSAWFPALLLFLAPAIAMGAWAEEKRDGTDELLLALPAREFELVLGKFLACVSIYTVAMLFAALGQVGVLLYLGRPDPGLLLGVYIGQWLAGAALLAVAMAASALTSNLTVSFILGALACAIFVGAGSLASLSPDTRLGAAAKTLSMTERFADFGRGVVTLPGVAYFLAVAAVGLWANMFLLGRAHWMGAPGSGSRSALAMVRGVSLLVAGLAIVALLGRTPVRADVTSERLWSLSKETRTLLDKIPQGRVAIVTAYVSPPNETPGAFTQTRENMLGALREIAAAAGESKVRLRIVETSPFSDAAREADKAFEIKPRTVPPMPDDPTPASRQVFLGVAATSGGEQAVIPFMSRGLPPEYEIARAIRSVTMGEKKKVGVLETEAGLFGRFNFQTFTPARDWPIIDELRRQYDVVKVARRQPIPADIAALIVAQPSTLTDAELPPVLEYLRAGRPALIVEDPLPLVNPTIATTEARDAGRNPFQQQQQQQEPKANLAPLWTMLGVTMDGTKVIWDAKNPRPQLAELPREFVFVGRGPAGGSSGGASTGGASFNETDAVTSGLQEVVLLASGGVKPMPGSNLSFTPLLSCSPVSGTVNYADVLQRSIFGFGGFNPNRKFARTPERPILAARISGIPPAPAPRQGEAAPAATGKPINVILLADLDALSEEIFRLREEGYQDMQFDNVTFVLNAVDSLTGDESLVDLRKRRRMHRTLTRLEDQRLAEQKMTQEAVEKANQSAEDELSQAKARLDGKVKEIEQRQDLDETQRRIMVESVRQAEQRRLDVQSAAIEDVKQTRVEDARADARRQIDRIEMKIRTAAVALPPIPALALGCFVFARRRMREREGVGADRLQ